MRSSGLRTGRWRKRRPASTRDHSIPEAILNAALRDEVIAILDRASDLTSIEEQRVRTVIDLIEPPEVWSALGHDFRVVVHITTWSSDDALVIPIGALFRQGDEWAAFVVRDGRAQATRIQIGRRNNRVAEVLAGLAAGDRVVLHPSDRIEDGTPVSERQD